MQHISPTSFSGFLKPASAATAQHAEAPGIDCDTQRLQNMVCGGFGLSPRFLEHATLTFLRDLPEGDPRRVRAGELIDAQLEREERFPEDAARVFITERSELAAQLLALMPGGPPREVLDHARRSACLAPSIAQNWGLLRTVQAGAMHA